MHAKTAKSLNVKCSIRACGGRAGVFAQRFGGAGAGLVLCAGLNSWFVIAQSITGSKHVTASVPSYPDGRPATRARLEATGATSLIQHGHGPKQSDYLGAREAICFRSGDTYYLHYDGAGLTGWLACLAISRDLKNWKLRGPVLDLGAPGEDDAGTASSPWTVFDGIWQHMFYVGSRTTTPPPNRIPAVPYFTLAAKSRHPYGPWKKQKGLVPFHTAPGTYYADTASPGQIVKKGSEYLMFFSAAAFVNAPGKPLKRTLGIARTENLDGQWKIDRGPILPPEQQIENSALYFEPTIETWFLFTNHIGMDNQGEYTESIWTYWSRDLNHWDPDHRAIVLDGANCQWCKRSIGMPSVVQVGNRLALFYDASPTGLDSNMGRDIGLAWLRLPLRAPIH